jgi:hypothetical protein
VKAGTNIARKILFTSSSARNAFTRLELLCKVCPKYPPKEKLDLKFFAANPKPQNIRLLPFHLRKGGKNLKYDDIQQLVNYILCP